VRYYYAEHEAGYEQVEREGRTQWSDLFANSGPQDFEAFPNRAFLERTLPQLDLPPAREVDVLEYGCGTGPAACFLAARGFQVEAIDLIPQAIELARRFARERGVDVAFGVQDMCALAHQPPAKRYGLIVDSFCLQSIVTDADRADLFAAVHGRLERDGYYLISTATYEADRVYEPGFRYDESTGICFVEVPKTDSLEDAVEIGGTWYRAHRRHLRPSALRDELTNAGFHVVAQNGPLGGDLVCVRSDSDLPSLNLSP
jgi:2-polyprenyl-3-methyl-5-hydroxy-6-metoxy-1,4-benzoquinol methylase